MSDNEQYQRTDERPEPPRMLRMPRLFSETSSTGTPELAQKLYEMIRLGFSEQSAAEYIGVPRTTVTSWKSTVDGFEQEVDQARGGGKRFVASQLMKLVLSGNVAATIFWLKTRTTEFREQKFPERESAADFAQAIREYMLTVPARDGLTPPEDGT